MTTLYALGSGSRGNCFAVECGGATLVIDAGFSAREIERRAEAIGLELSGVVGIVLTHEHNDHTCGAGQLARRLRAPIVTAPGTWRLLVGRLRAAVHRPVQLMGGVEIGPFSLETCLTNHDAAEPIALVIQAADGARVGVGHDLGRPTRSVRYLFRDLHALVLEANHDELMLRESGYPPSVQQRIIGSGGHLSNRAAAELIAELLHPALSLIVLAHLSERCNSAEQARDAVEPVLKASGYAGRLLIATQDHPLPPLGVDPNPPKPLPGEAAAVAL